MLARLLFCQMLATTTLLFGKGVEDAATYHLNSSQQWNVAVELLNTVAWEGEERVLDVGCGDGKITALIASLVPNGSVLGVDVSSSMVEFAASQFRSSNLDFKVADGAYLPFDESFDAVVSFSALHWVVEQEKALLGIYRALIPGGKVYLTTCGASPMNLIPLGEKLMKNDFWKPFFPEYQPQRVYFNQEQYLSLLERAGFQQVEVRSHINETLFPNRTALFQFIKPLINFIHHLPSELQEKFVDEIVNEVIALAEPSEDGSINFQVLILQVIAEK